MTRSEFIEAAMDIDDLYTFATEIGYDDIVEDIWDEESKDARVNDWLLDWVGEYSWYEIYRMLGDIPNEYGWYRYDGDFCPIDADDIEYIRSEIIEFCDNFDIWDEEKEEAEPEEDSEFDIESDDIFMNLIAN